LGARIGVLVHGFEKRFRERGIIHLVRFNFSVWDSIAQRKRRIPSEIPNCEISTPVR